MIREGEVHVKRVANLSLSSSSLRSEYVFTFDNTFELHQDVDILNKMGLDCGLYSGKVTPRSLAEAKSTLPKIFEPVIDGKSIRGVVLSDDGHGVG